MQMTDNEMDRSSERRIDAPAKSTLIDPEKLLERVDGDVALLRQMIELFEIECPRAIAQMRAAAESSDWPSLRRAAHAFKGSVGNFTHNGAFTTAVEVERLSAEGSGAEAISTLTALEQDAVRLVGALRAAWMR